MTMALLWRSEDARRSGDPVNAMLRLMEARNQVKINAAGHFCAAHQQEMDQALEPVEKWVAGIKLGTKNEASLRDQLDDQGVTEIDDLVEMDQEDLASLDLPAKPTKKFHAALYKLGNGSVQKPVQRRASATTEPGAMPFTEKWRQQAKLYDS